MKKAITESVKAMAHTPQYKMHKYFARRPYNVFSNLISHYTDKGDIILDLFCGGGVTVFEGCKLNRNVIGVDLNPLATFITKMQMFNKDINHINSKINEFVEKNINPLESKYTMTINNEQVYCRWIEWAYTVECPNCKSEIVLTESNKIKNGFYKCPNVKCKNHLGIARTKCSPISSIPVRIKYSTDKKNYKIKILTEKEKEIILDLEKELNEQNCYKHPSFEFPLNWDRQKEDKLYEKGIIRYEDLFSYRNLFILSYLFNKIIELKGTEDKDVVDCLYFIFSSTLRYTNKMSKVTDNWENGNPTCMDKHAYYLPNSFIENNVLEIFKDRINTIIKGLTFSKNELPESCCEINDFKFAKNSTNYYIINGSSDKLPLPDNSIDIIITDPPYGSNVQYAELSVVWNAWYQLYENKDNYIYREKEAVSNRKSNYVGAKDEKDYENLLYGIYKEAYRVLKDDSYMVFTFNNKNLNIWLAMLKAVAKSGFILAENGVLFQDFIQSYKNTSHLKYAGNVQGDFIYTFIKTNKKSFSNYNGKDLDEIIDNSVKNAIKKLFSSNKEIKSEELYQHLFTELASNLMNFIVYKQNNGEDLNILEFKEKDVDKHLEKYLTYKNGIWREK